MKTTYNFYPQQSSWGHSLLTKCLMALFIFVCLGHSAWGQPMSIPYPPTIINAYLIDTADVSPCRLPYYVSNKIPAPGETVKWRVLEGTATLSNTTQSTLTIQDMKEDTVLFSYTTYFPDNDSIVDSIYLCKNNAISCDIIDFPLLPGVINCSGLTTLTSKLANGYSYLWSSFSPQLQLINPFVKDVQFRILASGLYTLSVRATSPSGYNVIQRTYTFQANCPIPVTPANAGADVTIQLCQFPSTLLGNAPAPGETVKWEVVSGTAMLDNVNSRSARILDAREGAQLRYTISNGSQSSSDILIVHVNTLSPVICDPTLSNTHPVCGDVVTVNFPWVITTPPGNTYTFNYFPSSGLTRVGAGTGSSASFRVNQAGNHMVTIAVTTPYGYNMVSKTVSFSATCAAPVTTANAGPDAIIEICQFPYTLQGNAPAAGETVKWEVVSGLAMLDNATSRNARILDAKPGTQLRYTISNGTQSSSDVMLVQVNVFPAFICDPIISNINPVCGNIVLLNFPWAMISIPGNLYNFSYSSNPGLSRMGFGNTSSASFMVNQAGNHTVTITITTPFGYNTMTKTISITATCPPPLTQANAGPDATAYCHTFRLSGNQPKAGEVGTWSLLEGSALMSDMHNPTPTISNYGSDTLRFSWTISSGTNSTVDTVVIIPSVLSSSIVNVNPSFCGQNRGGAEASAAGGLPPYQFQWQGSAAGALLSNVPAGTYFVTVTDQSGCTVLDSATVADSCIVEEWYTLEGDVKAGANLLSFGLVILMQDINGLPVPVKTTPVINGHYKFSGVEESDYIIYVLPYKEKELINLHDQYLPTFYVNKVSIFFANPVYVIGNTYGVDIRLVEKKAQAFGAANLSAHLPLHAKEVTPLLPVLLFNAQHELVGANTYNGSDASFKNIAAGTYYLSIPVQGKGYENSRLFEITSGENDMDIATVTAVSEAAVLNGVNVFPNPFKESLMIDLSAMEGEVRFKLIDGVTGKDKKEMKWNAGDGQFQWNTEELPAGFYLLQFSSGDAVKTVPVIKY